MTFDNTLTQLAVLTRTGMPGKDTLVSAHVKLTQLHDVVMLAALSTDPTLSEIATKLLKEMSTHAHGQL